MSCRKECATKLAEYPHRDARQPGVSYEDAVSDASVGHDRRDPAGGITRADGSLRITRADGSFGDTRADRSLRDLPTGPDVSGSRHDHCLTLLDHPRLVHPDSPKQVHRSQQVGTRRIGTPNERHSMTLRTATTTLRNGITTSVAVLGIIVASTIGLHEWADAEAVRSLPAQTADTSTETTSAKVPSAEPVFTEVPSAETGLNEVPSAESVLTKATPAEATPTESV
jgi:hypothetical protein